MQISYFSTAWNDIRNSPNWFGKLVLLALIGCIPVFGWIVVPGYLFGWGRDIAWKVHQPLPPRIFANADGALYRRGFFTLVIAFICLLVPWAFEMVLGGLVSLGAGFSRLLHFGPFAFLGVGAPFFALLGFAAMLIALLFMGVGAMRMSIYGRLAPGLQFARLWSMIRYDFGGLARIIGSIILFSIIIGIVIGVGASLITLGGIITGASFAATGAYVAGPAIPGVMIGLLSLVSVVFIAAIALCSMVINVFMWAVATRALGYWMQQFDVMAWRGQDDPLPFELANSSTMGYHSGQQPPWQGV